MIRRVLSLLPLSFQDELRRARFLLRARSGKFSPGEPEAEILPRLVSPGDWCIDVGANVGQYTLLLSQLAGPTGHVFAFEPMAATAATLAAVCAKNARNVSVLHLAASDTAGIISFELPIDSAGLQNYERAHIGENGGLKSFRIPIDHFPLPHRISLVKIDAEGHESEVLHGMRQLMQRDSPVLIIEDNGTIPQKFLSDLGYRSVKIQPDSPNVVYLPAGRSDL
jgi:FkbM family methyltransferase